MRAVFGLVFIVLALWVQSCAFRDDKTGGNGSLNANSKMGYAEVNQVIFKPRCLSCHTPGNKKPDLSNYQAVKENLTKIHEMVCVKQKMPPRAPLVDNEMAYLKAWIDQGAPEIGSGTSTTPPGPEIGPVTRPVKWDVVNKFVFEPKCFNCHYPNNPHGDTDYTNLAALKDTMGSILFVTLTKPQMPPPPDSLSQAQKEILAAWVIDGLDLPLTNPTPSPAPYPSPFASPLPPSPVPSPSPSP